MGYLLKEALKTLCGVNQWSYAVFWKIGCQNPKLLIWEECYYETILYSVLPGVSGIESSELAFEEWEACWNSNGSHNPLLGHQAEDKIHLLINKMMICNQVNIVGEGLVGRAAFTGQHTWILSENCVRETQLPEVPNEVGQQISAGIKTVAVIPITALGVVQLGSSLAILENVAFVNDVKTLMIQLGCVPGALLSDTCTSKEPVPKTGDPICLGKTFSVESLGNYKVETSVPLVADGCSKQSISSQVMELVGEPSHLIIGQTQNNLLGVSSAFETPNMMENGIKLYDDLVQRKSLPIMKPSIPFSGQLENGITRAEVFSSDPDMWLNEQACLYSLGSGFDEQPSTGLSPENYGDLRSVEQISSDAVIKEHVKNILTMANNFTLSQLRTNVGLSSSESQLVTGANYKPRLIINPCSLPNMLVPSCAVVSSRQVARSKVNGASSKTEELVSDVTGHVSSSSGVSDPRHHFVDGKSSQIETSKRKERMENDLFQAVNSPLARMNEHTYFSDQISGFCHDDQKQNCANLSWGSKNARNEDECIRPSSGDDLFDILGIDFKNRLLKDGRNDTLNDDMGTTAEALHKNNLKSLNLHSSRSDSCTVGGGNSDNVTANHADHLLDAIVKIAAKQSSDDGLSCRTTLTKVVSSSVPDASPSYGPEGVSNQMQGELFGFPKSLTRLGAVGSCSFKSECSKEDIGNCSQASSGYGSQISSWVEHGHSIRQSNSTAAAYSKRPDRVNKTNRKRLKPGENPRPRPKDRQMIQDRMKELKEIIPNGAKCSIDALLERTIKHMLFLQSVTKHADKLKQTGESKIISKDGRLLLKDNFEGGRTWAYEVGSQSMVYPIIVEDLNAPRQMLVEMLCEERGLFLEIADIIRGLGLTILKGVMETRNDKIWARFAVEANRDVTRMEIFLSLIHFLEQTVKNDNAASGSGIENRNMIVHQSFQQAAPIPTTCRPCSLE